MVNISYVYIRFAGLFVPTLKKTSLCVYLISVNSASMSASSSLSSMSSNRLLLNFLHIILVLPKYDNIYNKNNTLTPITVTTAPSISFGFAFSLKTIMDKGIIVTGTMDVMADVIPTDVYCNDNSDNETPTKGPNMEPKVIPTNAFLSFNVALISSHFLR